MRKFYLPAEKPEDWIHFLAEKEKHWKPGFSAFEIANRWQLAQDFPDEVRKVFRKSGIGIFQNIEILFAFPEHQVALPPTAGHPSQNDIFILAKGNNQLVSIAVEAKVSEDFDLPIREWRKQSESKGKKERIEYLREKLGIGDMDIDHIRYQLIHRTASAIIEAERFNAPNAVMMVHSFSQSYEHFDDYSFFVELFGAKAGKDNIVSAGNIKGIELFIAWIRG